MNANATMILKKVDRLDILIEEMRRAYLRVELRLDKIENEIKDVKKEVQETRLDIKRLKTQIFTGVFVSVFMAGLAFSVLKFIPAFAGFFK